MLDDTAGRGRTRPALHHRRSGRGFPLLWQVQDSNLRSFRDGFTVRSHWPLGQPAVPADGAPEVPRVSARWKDSKDAQQSGNQQTPEATVADSSFDVVSKVDRQEVDNALNQAAKEVSQRYDFKGTDASVGWSGETILIKASSEERAKAVLDVLQTKLVHRGVSLKSLESGEPKQSGKEYRIESTLKEGLSQENAKKVSKLIRD